MASLICILLVALLLGCSLAYGPPRYPTKRSDEPLLEKKEYQPKAIRRELCRQWTPEQCRETDERMQRHHQRHKELQKRLSQERRQALLHNSTANTDNVHLATFQQILAQATRQLQLPTPTPQEEAQELQQLLQWDEQDRQRQRRHLQNNSPRVGTFRVLVLLMRFSDHTSRKLPDQYEYQILWNLRIRKWLIQNSYGQYDAFFHVEEWKTTDNTEAFYAAGSSATQNFEYQKSFEPLLNSMDNRAEWDWTMFDVDGNGKLDNLIVLHSGYPAEARDEDCEGAAEADRIWAHAYPRSKGWKNKDGTIEVEGFMTASALEGTCGSDVAMMGVMTHEYMHTFDFIDLYDISWQGEGVGNFDVMGAPYGIKNDGYMPVSLSAWGRIALDWLECPEQTSSGTLTLEPIVTSGPAGCLKINLQGAPGLGEEYLLLENRQRIGWDTGFWVDGVLIYHVDELVPENNNPGFPGQGGWPGNGNHYKVAVLPADGLYELEQNKNKGNEGDMWLPGSSIGPGDGKTYPNTDMYQSGDVKKSGITIDILEQTGNDIKVKITMGKRSGGDSTNNNLNVFSTPMKPQSTMLGEEVEEIKIYNNLPPIPTGDEEEEEDEEDKLIEILPDARSYAACSFDGGWAGWTRSFAFLMVPWMVTTWG